MPIMLCVFNGNLPLVVARLLICIQLIHNMMQECMFLLWEIGAIETRKRQVGQRGADGSCGQWSSLITDVALVANVIT